MVYGTWGRRPKANPSGKLSGTVSPPGDHVAFTVTTVVEKDNRRHREVWVQRLKAGAPDGKPFRFTDPTREASGSPATIMFTIQSD